MDTKLRQPILREPRSNSRFIKIEHDEDINNTLSLLKENDIQVEEFTYALAVFCAEEAEFRLRLHFEDSDMNEPEIDAIVQEHREGLADAILYDDYTIDNENIEAISSEYIMSNYHEPIFDKAVDLLELDKPKFQLIVGGYKA